MTFKHKAKSDIMKLCQVVVRKYMLQRMGEFWTDYAKETHYEFTHDAYGFTYLSDCSCDQSGGSECHIIVRLTLDDFAVYERVNTDFTVTWRD